MENREGYYFVFAGKRAFRLDGGSNIILEMNATLGLMIDKKNVRDYLVFFATFINGDAGPFPLLSGSSKKNMFMNSPKVVKAKKGSFLIEGFMLHENLLCKCNFEVTLDGAVEMLDDVPIACLELAMPCNPHLRSL